MLFGQTIIDWYKKNKRDLPWRNTKEPYFIWLSEIILQQTRVEQGLSYYEKFAKRFPTVKSLASANEDVVLKLWQGLGYYSRARNLHHAAKQVVKEFGGKFPADYEKIKSLKGVGDYTAAAIGSFAFELPHAVVDGNVFRLLSRYFGIDTPIDTTVGKKEFTLMAQAQLGDFQPSLFNQAIMEFGARQCKPGKPDCASCPLASTCFAFRENVINNLPVKKNTVKSRNRYFHYLVISDNDCFFVKKRTAKDIWNGLHDFPVIETEKPLSEKALLKLNSWKEKFDEKKFNLLRVSDEYKHILSHQLIHARFYEIKSEHKSFAEEAAEWKVVNSKSVKKLAVPRLIEQYLDERM